jgi:hypothetical protein
MQLEETVLHRFLEGLPGSRKQPSRVGLHRLLISNQLCGISFGALPPNMEPIYASLMDFDKLMGYRSATLDLLCSGRVLVKESSDDGTL